MKARMIVQDHGHECLILLLRHDILEVGNESRMVQGLHKSIKTKRTKEKRQWTGIQS